ncbi:MAG TPA: hypothetical protein VHM90_20670 [Phycisphaerae bacterium]|jgi:hypothetical protein|nr:hypothetical protein [Phycisphaerae bacterium]
MISRRASQRRRGAFGAVRRGSSLLMALMYVTLFGALAASMTLFSTSTLDVSAGNERSIRAQVAAESGVSWLMLQFKTLAQNNKLPITSSGVLSNTIARNLFNGTGGLAPNLAAQLNGTTNLQGKSVITNATTIQIPPVKLYSSIDDSQFCISIVQDSSVPTVLHITSMGKCSNVMRAVQMDVSMSKQLKYAVYSNVAIQIGKNVRVQGDVASAYAGTNKGPPVQMFSDFHYMNDLSSVDTDLGKLRTLLSSYDNVYNNRLDVRNNSAAASAAAAQGLSDRNSDGFIDEYDVFLKGVDANGNAVVTSGEFTDPLTGKPYDADLWNLIDDPLGASATGMWSGYNDGQISNFDGYAKVNGTIKMAITPSQWMANSSSWPLWGDNGGTRQQDFIEGPVIPTDPTAIPVQFGYDFSSDLTMKPGDFDTTGSSNSTMDSAMPTTTATVSGSTISNGTLTSAMANGGTVTEHSPASVSSGWQATYKRPVFQNITFNNVRIPKGLNAKFINCTFNGYTAVKLTTTITDPSTGATTSDPSIGQTWAKQMTSGSFSADTALTSSNSKGFQNGNNLHFSGCTFNGVLSSDVPTAYTHFANSWEFDGSTTINNTVDQSVTIMAPNTNIEIGSYVDPAGNPSTLVGVVVAGNIDIRGTANVDGSLIVTGNGATNTTLGYFGSTDSGQAVPSLSELPSTAHGQYGHLFFKYNPNRGMPNGINIPITLTAAPTTYKQISLYVWPW